jgi:hypothetical protein
MRVELSAMLVVITAVAPRMLVVPPVVLAIVIAFAVAIMIATAMSVAFGNNAPGR